uniref:Uncharacterized protein n=1 Tax=Anguilla anguilla TaxID=7936 RepID=A0A0E9QTD7_ANGAN
MFAKLPVLGVLSYFPEGCRVCWCLLLLRT